MSRVDSIISTNEELGHHFHSENQFPANQKISNTYHHRNRGTPMKALGEALKNSMSLDIIIAIIADPRCGLERRSADGDGYFTFSSSQTFSNSTLPSVHGVNCFTPLFLAVIYCRVDVVRTLLEGSTLLSKEADVNAVDRNGFTSLHFAARYGQTASAELLIAKEANVKAVDTNGSTPLHVAAECGHTACAELLIAKGTDVNAVDRNGFTPLHVAAVCGRTACAKLLIAKGADVNVANVRGRGRTPLHDTTAYGNIACAELLTSEGADVNAVDDKGHTPLHVAAVCGNNAITKLFTAHGADLNAIDDKGHTPFHVAAAYGTACSELLKHEGASMNVNTN